jgi:hypothetical protein
MTHFSMKTAATTNAVLIASLVLFVVACCLPALEFRKSNNTHDVMFGLRAFVVGWSGFFAGVNAWFANPVWMLGMILVVVGKNHMGLVTGVVAIAIAATTFSILGRELPGDEGNVTKTTVIKLLPGCYVWLASLVLLPIAALFQRTAST